RLARASLGAPMVLARDVTDRIHGRSGGVPRLINVIADAALVFGYGEERSEIDAALVDEVIKDLDETGVLGPRPNPNRRASVVPADPVAAASDAASGFSRTPAGPADAMGAIRPKADATHGPDDERRQREIAERERLLHQREQEMASREKELAEQRRVLAE